MDIEARFRQLAENPTAPISAFDAFYDDAVIGLSNDLPRLDSYIARLRDLCVDRAIDHSRFTLKGSQPLRKPLAADTKSNPKSDFRNISTVDVSRIVRSCREKCPFLSFAILSVPHKNPTAPQKFKTLSTECIDQDWVSQVFKPDVMGQISRSQKIELDSDSSWVVLCLFHSRDRDQHAQITGLLTARPEIRILDLDVFEAGEPIDSCWRQDRTRPQNGTALGKPSIIVHDLLDAEEEHLIKEFFGPKAGFLRCVGLKGGNSGTKVILVTQSIGPGDARKHVVKIEAKSKHKLQKEIENFQNYVDPYWIQNQPLEIKSAESPRYRAIKYPFASQDTIHESTSLTDRYIGGDSGGESVEGLRAIIQKIFEHQLCKRWREKTSTRKEKIADVFTELLDWPETERTLDLLLSPSYSVETKLDRAQLRETMNSSLEFVECLNHGDLHSDNVQVEIGGSNVYLIDFGWTGKFPAGLDYAMLEASIRFKLLDPSIDIRIHRDADANPFDKFDASMGFGESTKDDGDRARKISLTIRERFLNDFYSQQPNLSALKAQYLCCLLVLCLRQIAYKDMNRRYILQIIGQIMPQLHLHLATSV